MAKVLVVSDTHFPFESNKAMNKLIDAIKQEKPTHVVQIGDLLDQYVFSKYSKKSSITTQKDVVEGLKSAKTFWEGVHNLAPRAKRIQLLGNHCVRLNKRIAERLPELYDIFNLKDIYQFPGVEVLKSERHFKVIDGVIYTHGWLSKSIDHAIHFNKPTVHGHRHRPCIETKGKLWSMDVGYLANPESVPLKYTMSKCSQWRHAYGIVEDGIPRLVLL